MNTVGDYVMGKSNESIFECYFVVVFSFFPLRPPPGLLPVFGLLVRDCDTYTLLGPA